MEEVLNRLLLTATAMQKELSPETLAIWARDLMAKYDPDVIILALDELRTTSDKLSEKAIIDQIEAINADGRPGADEAWGMIPHNDRDSAVITEEMAEAMQAAQPLLDEGDSTGARMAFRDAYTRIVTANKRAGILPKWFPYLGEEQHGRQRAIAEAIRMKRMLAEDAIALVGPDKAYPMLELAGEHELAKLHKPIFDEAPEYFAMWKNMLKKGDKNEPLPSSKNSGNDEQETG